MRKVKVAIYSRDLGVGGIQKTLMNVLRLLDKDGYEVDLFLFSRNVFFEEQLPKNVTVRYKKQNALLSRIAPLFLHRWVYKNMNEEGYDYVVDFDGFLNTQSAMAINTPAKKRVVWVHTDITNIYKYYSDRPVIFLGYLLMHLAGHGRYKYFDTVVGVSEPILDGIKKKYPKKEYRVIPNGVDVEEILDKSKEQAPVVFDDNKYNLISVGRIAHQKDYPGTVSMLADILKRREDIHYYIVGDGRDRGLVEEEIERHALRDKVTLLGATSNPFMYLKQADGFVLNSRFEGQGIVLEEARIFDLDLYYPKRLSDYIPNLSGYRRDFHEIHSAKKRSRKIDYLKEYNSKIESCIKLLFNGVGK